MSPCSPHVNRPGGNFTLFNLDKADDEPFRATSRGWGQRLLRIGRSPLRAAAIGQKPSLDHPVGAQKD
jgi:hypothetical protein